MIEISDRKLPSFSHQSKIKGLITFNDFPNLTCGDVQSTACVNAVHNLGVATQVVVCLEVPWTWHIWACPCHW